MPRTRCSMTFRSFQTTSSISSMVKSTTNPETKWTVGRSNWQGRWLMSSLREKAIEASLVGEVKGRGGMCPKFTSPGMDGLPDRLVLLPHGRFCFVEVKAPGEKPRPLQVHRHKQLRR